VTKWRTKIRTGSCERTKIWRQADL